MSKKFLALSLLLAVPSVKPVVPAAIAGLVAYAVPVVTVVASETLETMSDSEEESCKNCTRSANETTRAEKVKEFATDVVVAECCAGTVACIDSLKNGKGLADINYKDVLKEGAFLYCTVKLSKSEKLNNFLSRIPGLRLMANKKDERSETKKALVGGARATMVYAGLKACAQLAMDLSKKYLTKTTV